jgi:cytochrome c5
LIDQMMKHFSIALASVATIVLISNVMANHNSEESLQARVAAVGSLNIGEGSSESGTADAGPVDGKSVYDATCAVCHASGVAGAPILGEVDDWEDRVGEGIEIMVEHAIQGYTGNSGVMPPKGGNASLSDDAVTAAVQFMVDQVK